MLGNFLCLLSGFWQLICFFLFSYYKHPVFGKGKEKPEEWWKCLADMMEAEKYWVVKKINNPYSTSKFAMMHNIVLEEKVNENIKNKFLDQKKSMYSTLKV
jgi:superfamily II DNA helicase RecQ